MNPFSPLDGEALLLHLQPQRHGIRGKFIPNIDLTKVTWFRAGGKGELFFQPVDEEDLLAFLAILPPEIPLTIVGLGTNLLIRDGGIKGVILRLSSKGFGGLEQINEREICAGAGVSDKRLAAFACERGVGGFHFFHGVPGGVGGAVAMNAGANGLETSQRVVSVRMVNRKGKITTLPVEELGYSYRQSCLPKNTIVLSAVLAGEKALPHEIEACMQEVTRHRTQVQPVREKTGGSTFKNLKEISAWQALDQAGCRGLTIGGAQFSSLHCNFMVNLGYATAYDLELLGESARARVFEKLGLRLEWEIKRLGQFAKGYEVSPFDNTQ